MALTLQEKEEIAKTAVGKKIRIFSILPTGGIGRTEGVLKDYRVLETASMILSVFEVAGEESMGIINSDLVEVYNEEKKEWEDLYGKA